MTGLDFRSLAKGDALPPFPVAFGEDDVRAYLDATGEPPERWSEAGAAPPERWSEAGAAPPLAAGAFAIAALLERVALPDGALHAGQEFEFLRAVVPGEPLEAEVRVAQRSERRGALLLALDIELRGAGGETVLRGRSTVAAPPAPDGGGASGGGEASP